MRTRWVVLGLVCGLAAAASAGADCHDPGHRKTVAPGAKAERLCVVPFNSYKALLGSERTDNVPNLRDVLIAEARLTGSDDSAPLDKVGQDEVYKALQGLESKGYQAAAHPAGGHLKIHHGFLGWSKTTLEHMAQLRWDGVITLKDDKRKSEHVTAVLLHVSDDEKMGWKIVSLHIERRSLAR
jgi:hypothetical protein